LIGDAVELVVVVDGAAVLGVLIMNGDLVPPSYKLALKPDNGARET
jgi:hypothetical protein